MKKRRGDWGCVAEGSVPKVERRRRRRMRQGPSMARALCRASSRVSREAA